jgi:hypothetical protein
MEIPMQLYFWNWNYEQDFPLEEYLQYLESCMPVMS